MYTDINFKTKKALQEAIKEGKVIGIYQPNDIFGVTERVTVEKHSIAVEGPHYPEAHRRYAQVEVEDGRIVKVR